MPWKKILFIFNPVAGRSQIRGSLLDILEILSKADYKVVCYPTRGRDDARRLVRERQEDYLYIVCAGGDGTLDEVVSGMMENPEKPFVPIGYIPAGTTNDFASSLHIPSDMLQAARIVAHGRTFRCDLGLFNEKDYFTYVAAFGLFTGASYQTPQELKNQLGHLAYILQGMTELGNMRAYHMQVEAVRPAGTEAGRAPVRGQDPERAPETEPVAEPETKQKAGRETKQNAGLETKLETGLQADQARGRETEWDPEIRVEGNFAFGMITNSRSIGGFSNITGTHVDLQDGLFEVTLIRMPRNPLEMSEILMAIGNPDMQSEMVISFKTSHIVLTCTEQIAWTRDGEYAGSHKRVELRNCPGQLRILVPEEYAGRS